MDKIGNRDIVYSGSFIVPAGESVWITADAEGWIVKFNIQFDNSGTERSVTIEPQSDHVKVIFKKWDNAIGTATVSPAPLGTHNNGKQLSFMATNYLIGNTNSFQIQILLGGGQ